MMADYLTNPSGVVLISLAGIADKPDDRWSRPTRPDRSFVLDFAHPADVSPLQSVVAVVEQNARQQARDEATIHRAIDDNFGPITASPFKYATRKIAA